MRSMLSAIGKMKFITLNRELHKWAGIVLSIGVLVITVTGFALLHDKSWTWMKQTTVPEFLVPSWALEEEQKKAQEVKALAAFAAGPTADSILVGTKAGVSRGESIGFKPMGLPGGRVEVTAILLGDDRWLVGSTTGLFQSRDRGATWEAVAQGPWNQARRTKVNTLVAAPASADLIYAGTKMGLYRTTDGGATWESLNDRVRPVLSPADDGEDMEKALEVMAIAFVAAQPNILLLGTHHGLYRFDARDGKVSPLNLDSAVAGLPPPRMSLAKYFNDLHTGKLFAHKLWIAYDLVAIGLVMFVATGVYIWLYPKLRRRQVGSVRKDLSQASTSPRVRPSQGATQALKG